MNTDKDQVKVCLYEQMKRVTGTGTKLKNISYLKTVLWIRIHKDSKLVVRSGFVPVAQGFGFGSGSASGY
jgi:hypothetical protein